MASQWGNHTKRILVKEEEDMQSKHLDFMILQRKKEGMKRAKAAFVAAEKNGTLQVLKSAISAQ